MFVDEDAEPVTVNDSELAVLVPLIEITKLPLVAPVGTTATICVSLQLAVVAVMLLNETVLVPLVVPKPLPLIVTEAPTGPLVGVRERIVTDVTAVN